MVIQTEDYPLRKLIKKWDEIIEDYEANVTHIYERRIVHRIFDVVAHSVLQFRFKGKLVERGWIDAMIAGDTRTGKSEVAKQLCRHCRLPKPIVGENLSLAGLVGGVQSVGDKWSINWGAWPRMDRRMSVIDETTSMSTDQIGNLSDVRSSGRAVITKIQSDTAWARVRKLWLSNVRQEKNLKVSSYTFGCLVIPPIMGRPEDIARFDFATVLALEEVSEDTLNSPDLRQKTHRYTSVAAHELVFWAWTRRPEDVVFVDGAENAILGVALKQCKQYSSEIPLVEQGEQRYRVARVAVALAARFHSTDSTGQKVLVTEDHVELADWFFKQCYNREYFGYDRFSLRGKGLDEAPVKEAKVNVDDLAPILAALQKYRHAKALIEAMAFTEDFNRLVLLEPRETPNFLAELLELGLLEQAPEGLRKTKRFMRFFRYLGGKGIDYRAPY